MKANHNSHTLVVLVLGVVVNISSSKNESKSQRTLNNYLPYLVVVNISSSKNESKSQPSTSSPSSSLCCCKYQ